MWATDECGWGLGGWGQSIESGRAAGGRSGGVAGIYGTVTNRSPPPCTRWQARGRHGALVFNTNFTAAFLLLELGQRGAPTSRCGCAGTWRRRDAQCFSVLHVMIKPPNGPSSPQLNVHNSNNKPFDQAWNVSKSFQLRPIRCT